MDSNERWTAADNGLLSPVALSNPATAARAGMGYVTGATELNGHYVLAQRNEPSLLPTLGGVFESENPRDGWTPISSLAGHSVIAMAHTSRVIVVLTRDDRAQTAGAEGCICGATLLQQVSSNVTSPTNAVPCQPL